MSPTVFQYKNYRFFFFSREEPRTYPKTSLINNIEQLR